MIEEPARPPAEVSMGSADPTAVAEGPQPSTSERTRGGSHRKRRPAKTKANAANAPAPAAPVETSAETPPPSDGPTAQPKKQRPFLLEVFVLLCVAFGIALLVHTFLFQAFFIPSGSMENTLHVGDRVLVNRLSYKVGHVQRGQIVVFNGEDSWTPETTTSPATNPVARVARDVGSFLGFAPAGEKDFIKRVIGVPGDHVTCCDDRGRISVNGKKLDETYLAAGIPAVHTTTQVNAERHFDIVVPPGRLWVEGDHRDDSADSRSHTGDAGGGTIPESKVIGRAFVIVWPVKHWGGLGIPSAFHGVPKGASAAAVAGLPYGVSGLAVLPVGVWRLRKRRPRRAVKSRPPRAVRT